ncbi:hypothetical protein TRFO_32786 [Tritrichomonas foetus]|uniref:Uncharacterized protein n=1 Tax=Tritrichomonas foetus TaxID=1144522 RepID=A0A1J4JTB4_9EUKA|nr:hypothetical protein TRFO_32786 [Tritrichomonas foetus]|eukprot:OHT00509.1 hypothetical protein TRFO_32786 [Tritrichomonas foetus]
MADTYTRYSDLYSKSTLFDIPELNMFYVNSSLGLLFTDDNAKAVVPSISTAKTIKLSNIGVMTDDRQYMALDPSDETHRSILLDALWVYAANQTKYARDIRVMYNSLVKEFKTRGYNLTDNNFTNLESTDFSEAPTRPGSTTASPSTTGVPTEDEAIPPDDQDEMDEAIVKETGKYAT